VTRDAAPIVEIFLHPGEFFFGGEDTRIRTLLGSCVAITVWHPVRRIGGMCHYMLPTRGGEPTGAPEGRYADEAIELFLREIRAAGTSPYDYQAKLFGGGDQFPGIERRLGRSISQRNLAAGLQLVDRQGFTLIKQDLGGTGYRSLIFDVSNGDVWMRKVPTPKRAPASAPGEPILT
jgi:chemotaxis protein CheD